MCMRKGNGQCIFTGNLISDNSFVAVTAESGQCRPFSSDPLEVSTSIALFYEMCTYVLLPNRSRLGEGSSIPLLSTNLMRNAYYPTPLL